MSPDEVQQYLKCFANEQTYYVPALELKDNRRAANKERIAIREKAYREANKDRYAALSYFSCAGLRVADVPPELLKTKEMQVSINRQLKEVKDNGN